MNLEGPFAEGQIARGRVTHPGSKIIYSKETPTVVEFQLEPSAGGTLLTLTESGFDKIPSDRRLEAFRRNDDGWAQQMVNIANRAAQNP